MKVKITEITPNKKGELYARCRTVEADDEIFVKLLRDSQYEVGEEVDLSWEESGLKASTGVPIMQEVVKPVHIDENGEKQETPDRFSIPDTQYLIGLLETMAVSMFEAADIDMDLEMIRMLATERAVKNMERGQL